MFNENSAFPFTPWDLEGSTTDEFESLFSILKTHQKDLFIADFTHLEMNVCHIIVPDFQRSTRLMISSGINSNRGIKLRPLLNQWLKTPDDLTLVKAIIALIDELELNELDPIKQLLGLSTDPTSPWANLRVGELLALLHLANKDYDQALDLTLWVLDLAGDPEVT